MVANAKTYLVSVWSLAGVCFLTISARLAVRTWKRMWSFWLSEVFLILAFMTFLTLIIGDTYSIILGHDKFDLTFEYTEDYKRWLYGAYIIFDMGFYFPRFSLLAFYNELFPISEEILRMALYAVAIYNFCAFLTAGLVDIFWCGLDTSQNWKHDSSCTVLSVTEMLWINWVMGIVAELLVFILPFGMLPRLKVTPKTEKIALIGIFAIGTISLIASVARCISTARAFSSFNTYIIGSTEIATQIIVVALPALRPLLPIISAGWVKVYSYRGTGIYHSREGRSHGTYNMADSTQTRDLATRVDNSDLLPDLEPGWTPPAAVYKD